VLSCKIDILTDSENYNSANLQQKEPRILLGLSFVSYDKMKLFLAVVLLCLQADGLLGIDLKACDPYLESACKIVGEMLGKTLKKSDDYVTKGCYHYEEGTYKDKIYYGNGGKLEEKKKNPSKSGQSRPAGIDCKTQCKEDSDCNQLYPSCKKGTCQSSTTETATTCCQSISVTASEQAKSKQSSRMGEFIFYKLGLYGRPIYINSEGQYLYFASDGKWKIGKDYKGTSSGISHQTCKEDCPIQCTNEWEYYTKGKWHVDESIKISCVILTTPVDAPEIEIYYFNHPICESAEYKGDVVEVLTMDLGNRHDAENVIEGFVEMVKAKVAVKFGANIICGGKFLSNIYVYHTELYKSDVYLKYYDNQDHEQAVTMTFTGTAMKKT